MRGLPWLEVFFRLLSNSGWMVGLLEDSCVFAVPHGGHPADIYVSTVMPKHAGTRKLVVLGPGGMSASSHGFDPVGTNG